jgi:hypothetical protein
MDDARATLPGGQRGRAAADAHRIGLRLRIRLNLPGKHAHGRAGRKPGKVAIPRIGSLYPWPATTNCATSQNSAEADSGPLRNP